MHWRRFCAVYIIPAAIFQSVIIGGGYGTGREIVEYVTRFGPAGGLLAIAVIACLFVLVLSASFAFAVRFKVFNYRDFLKELLGPIWIIYEVLFVLLLVLVLAIVTSATTTLAETAFNIGMYQVWLFLSLAILGFTYFGRPIVKFALTIWTLLLMGFLVTLIVSMVSVKDILLLSNIGTIDWLGASISGMRFAIYNSALIPVLMYAASEIETTDQAVKSGVIAGLFGVLPALLLHVGFIGFYPEINQLPVPTYHLVEQSGIHFAVHIYFFILIGTILLTAVGVLQGVNDRIDSWLKEVRNFGLSNRARSCSSLGITIASLLLSQFGLINLIAKGYGALSWGFMVIFTLPLLTIGLKRLIIKEQKV
ncbi:MAG: hypothetical protein CMO22_02080 [Thiotrichales bacterium]|nr:hypothetical protein [Thiotrichales bacterium]OUX53468.1 MAG: hypothetical protein CBE42_01795 [Methylococcaceae bacterium TMED282]